MTQVTTYSLPDGSGDDVWLALQAILPAIRDFNSGPTPPPNPVAHMPWIDTSTSPWTFRIRNADNSAWVTLLTGLGATATGTAVLTAAGPPAARTALGATGTGSAVFTAADAAAARGAIAAPAIPSMSAGPGQVALVNPGFGNAFVTPAGGTWLVWATQAGNTGLWAFTHFFDIVGGGTSIGAPGASWAWIGFSWRVQG